MDDMEYLYVMLDSMGTCWKVIDGGTEKVAGLPSVLAEGWRPVREIDFAGGAYILIRLERPYRKGSRGFGFD